MSSVKRPTLKKVSLNNEMCSLDLITVEKEIKETEEKLDALLAKREYIYEQLKDVPSSYFC